MRSTFLVLCLMLSICVTGFAKENNKVLIVSSYGTDYQWANSIVDGMSYKLHRELPGVELNVEYLSSEMFGNTDSWVRKMELILDNYGQRPPLAVMLISDEAWMAYRAAAAKKLEFKGVPLILCAVKPHSITIDRYVGLRDSLQLSMFGQTKSVMKEYNATGVLRRMNIDGYLSLMADVVPGIDNFLFITDKRFYGLYVRLLLAEKAHLLYPQFAIEYIDAFTTNTNMLLDRLDNVKANTGVLMTSWLTGEYGFEYSKDFIYKTMGERLSAPIFLTNDLGLQNGYFIGGYFNVSDFWGERAGDKLVAILKGTEASAIPVDTYNDDQCHVDWRTLTSYNLNIDDFPKNTVYCYQPESFFDKYRYYVLTFGAILSVIMASYVYVIRSHLRLQRAQKETLKSVAQANEANKRLSEARNSLTIALEKAEQSDRLKSAFIANMSHEIRTPLNAIVGFSSILATIESEQERVEFAAIIERNSDLLLQLISDILDISKFESGMVDFSSDNIDASSICMDIVVAQRGRCAEGVSLKFMSPSEHLILYTDSGCVTQILTNFAVNAMKFTERGEIKIGYSSYDEQTVEFYVQDMGIGIEPEKAETIFERFVKLNSYVEGTGLGLALCKTIVDKMGGQIGVDSKLGEGSRFWFRIKKRMDKDK